MIDEEPVINIIILSFQTFTTSIVEELKNIVVKKEKYHHL